MHIFQVESCLPRQAVYKTPDNHWVAMLLSLIFKRAFSLAAKKKSRVNLPAPKAKRREFK